MNNQITITDLCKTAYENSKSKGFWDGERNKGEMIALMHSELSECLEGLRKNLMDDHIPEFTQEAAELADTMIRIADYCGGFGIDLEAVIRAKMQYNANRPYKHGKKF